MIQTIIRYTRGFLLVQICGYSPERFINLCKNKGIIIWGLEASADCYRMYISIDDFRKLKPILKKSGTKISVQGKRGIPFFVYKHRKRKAFVIGALLSLLCMYALSLAIWNITIDGNRSITDETLLEFLKKENVSYGTMKQQVNCERIVKDMRKNFDNIVWVSVSKKGTCLQIQVKENTDSKNLDNKRQEPSDIFACKEGKIIEIVTRSGTPRVQIGDIVKEGQVLVSGKLDIKNDLGEVIDVQLKHADADIIAETTYSYTEELQFRYQKKIYTGKKKKKLSIAYKYSKIKLGFKKNKFAKYDIFSSNKQIKLGEKIELPLTITWETICEYIYQPDTYTLEEAKVILSSGFETYLSELERQGSVVKGHDVKIYHDKNKAYAKGTITVWEDIGKQGMINIDL